MESDKIAESQWQYPSLEASGHVEVEIPSLPGSANPTESLHARNFGSHMAAQIEASLKPNPFPRSSPQRNPVKVLAHYCAVARGAKLLDPGTLTQLERLAAEFRSESDKGRQNYFETMIKPFLNGLKPERRKQ